jgi:hypothetical protein
VALVHYVPRAMLARQMTTTQVINFGTMPVAALVAGWLGSAVGVRETIALMVLIHLLACAGFWWSPLRGRRDLPHQVEHPGERAHT